jgi:thiamine-phosphate pyrophosphorylase
VQDEFFLSRLHYIADHPVGTDAQQVLGLVGTVLEAGVRLVQVRCKGCADRDRYELARAAVSLCLEWGAACVVNDRVDIALAAGASGVHLGREDLPVAEARRLLGKGALVGATARSPGEAIAAEKAGASYVGVGPCYATKTKSGLPSPLGPGGVAAVAGAVSVPVVAIGGVNAGNAAGLLAAGAYGVAVVSAIAAAQDPFASATRLLRTLESAAA